jgi:hypothetical protein
VVTISDGAVSDDDDDEKDAASTVDDEDLVVGSDGKTAATRTS